MERQDTKKPVVKAKKKTITIKGELSEKNLIKKIRQNVTATDSGEKLSSKYVTVNAKTLLKAMKSKKYGTYRVIVIAKDKAGNKSKKLSIKVKYVNPNPKPNKPDDTEQPDDNTDDDNQKPDDNTTDEDTKDDSSTGENGDNENKDNENNDNENKDNTNQDGTTNGSNTTNELTTL